MIKSSRFTFLLFLLFFQACKTVQQAPVRTPLPSSQVPKNEDFSLDTKPIFNPSMDEKKISVEPPKNKDLNKPAIEVAKNPNNVQKPPRKKIFVYIEPEEDEMRRMMDEQMADLRAILPSAEVERISEKKIRVSFDPNIYFLQNSTQFTSEAAGKIALVSSILKKYAGCDVLIEGHEDKTEQSLQHYELSEKRGLYFLEYLVGFGVERERTSFMGYGSLKANGTHHRLNRRIHLVITVDEHQYRNTKK